MSQAEEPVLGESRREVDEDRTIAPLFVLKVPLHSSDVKTLVLGAGGNRSGISSVCFLPSRTKNHDWFRDVDGSEHDTSDDDEPEFRCNSRTNSEKKIDRNELSGARDATATLSLGGMFLASSHSNGESFLWDLGRRRIVAEFSGIRGPGLVLRRMGQDNNLLYQTRDEKGTVSIHSVETQLRTNNRLSVCPSCPVVAKFETNSRTFCAAAPCFGNANLVALPAEDETMVVVRDLRVPSTMSPVTRFRGGSHSGGGAERGHGMLTSLAMSEACSARGWPVVSCGMEDGSVFFHDLRKPGHLLEKKTSLADQSRQEPTFQKLPSLPCACIKLGSSPVLGLDVVSSSSTSTGAKSVVAIAGMAGDAADISELPERERGTVTIIKAFFPSEEDSAVPVARLRARLPTCRLGADVASVGKPGVSVCRFRPDGRIFAVGGWDKRLRIFDRTCKASPLAILKAHADSVAAVDWASDSAMSGIVATGAGDGRICLWRCFPSYK